jgi:hypothetical protein
MCLICVDFQRQRLSISEARRAFGEMAEGLGAHRDEVEAMLEEAEQAQQQAQSLPKPQPSALPAINAGGVVTKP